MLPNSVEKYFLTKKGIEDVLHRSCYLFVCVFEDTCVSSSGLGTPRQ
jgi:hypothetical protein